MAYNCYRPRSGAETELDHFLIHVRPDPSFMFRLRGGRRWPILCDVLFGIVEPISRAPIIAARRSGTE
jgi:hypothetical protein